jgi:hypothetical protein
VQTLSAPRPEAKSETTSPAKAEAKVVTLTVANVRMETALLYTVGEDGKLSNPQKLIPGEVWDYVAKAGTRWVAVFVDTSASETFTVPQADATWLLRREKQKVTPVSESADKRP